MKKRRPIAFEVFDNPVLVGTITILVIVVAVYLSYIAENGLPFVPTYNVKVQVSDAAELDKNADVRIGGARVGQVLTITPEVADKQYHHPYAELGLALQKSLEPLPVNTKYQVRLASVLGGKYVELIPGNSHQGVPDGGTLALTENPKTNHNLPFVDLDEAFRTFGPRTEEGIRSATSSLADAVAGRGADFNDAIANTRRLIGPLESLLRLFSDPSTALPRFISGLAATTGALAPVAPTVSSLLSDGATTFAALGRSDLGETLDALPPTETLGTTVLRNARPVLSDAAAIIAALKPGARLLPSLATHLDGLLRAAPAVFRKLPAVATALEDALRAVRALAADPAATGVFKVLGTNDLGTAGASAFVGLGAILNSVAPGQFDCNVIGDWVANFQSSLSEGDAASGWLRISAVVDGAQLTETSTPSPDLHDDMYPIEDTHQCQGANDVYSGAQKIGDPGRTSTTVEPTQPPPGVLALGRKAGLVP